MSLLRSVVLVCVSQLTWHQLYISLSWPLYIYICFYEDAMIY